MKERYMTENLWLRYLFQQHAEAELRAWARRLTLFRFFRAFGGHANDGDSLDVVYAYANEAQLVSFLTRLGIEIVTFDVKPPQPESGVPYPGDAFMRFPSLIPDTAWMAQPGHCKIMDIDVFVWCNGHHVKISLHDGYEVSERNVSDAERLEAVIAGAALQRVDPPGDTRHYICPRYYPDFFVGARRS